jgi:hypothetical protein
MYDNEICETFWTPREVRRMRDQWKISDSTRTFSRSAKNAAAPDYWGPTNTTPLSPSNGDADAEVHAELADAGIVTLVGADCRLARVGFNQEANIRLSFDLKQTLPEPHLELQLRSEDGSLICVLKPPRARSKPLAAGRCSITASVVDLPLAAGACSVVLVVREAKAGLLYRAPVADLWVNNDHAQGEVGLLAPSYRWQLAEDVAGAETAAGSA